MLCCEGRFRSLVAATNKQDKNILICLSARKLDVIASGLNKFDLLVCAN
jgi:hypothetical protein